MRQNPEIATTAEKKPLRCQKTVTSADKQDNIGGHIKIAGFRSSIVLQMQSRFPHLFFGCHITNIVVFGKVGLDDSETGVAHSLAHCFSEVS